MRIPIAVVLAVLAGAGVMRGQQPTQAAQASAEAWVALVDSESYAASWDAAAAAFKTAVTQEQWASAARQARTPFGALQSRTLKSATATTTLPGAPDGDYVVLQFDTAFAAKAAAVETIVTMRETDGAWRVGGYFVK